MNFKLFMKATICEPIITLMPLAWWHHWNNKIFVWVNAECFCLFDKLLLTLISGFFMEATIYEPISGHKWSTAHTVLKSHRSQMSIIQLNQYITATFGTTKTWSLYRNTVSNKPLIKWLLCTGFLRKSASQIWHENYLGQNQPFTKFIEAANNLMKLVEVGKHFMKLVKLWTSLPSL